jgi:hypothetical protein
MNITNATQLFMNMTNTSWVTAITNPYYLNMSNTSNWNLNKYWMGTLAWNNISARNLDIAWTGTLGWENLTARSLNIVWSGTLDASNISGIISKAQLSPQVYFVNNTGLSADNITSGTVSIARLHTNIKWVNSTQTLTGGNITALTNSSLNQSWAMMYSNITGGFPAACTSGTAITQLGSTPTCTQFMLNTTNSSYQLLTNQTWVTVITNPYYYNMTNNTFNYMQNTSLQFKQNDSVLTNLVSYTGWLNMTNLNISTGYLWFNPNSGGLARAGNSTNNMTINTTGCWKIQGNTSSLTIC